MPLYGHAEKPMRARVTYAGSVVRGVDAEGADTSTIHAILDRGGPIGRAIVRRPRASNE